MMYQMLQPCCVVTPCFQGASTTPHIMFFSGSTVQTNKLPKNIHGDREFLVKLASRTSELLNPWEVAMLAGTGDVLPSFDDTVMVYDKSKSFMTQVSRQQPGFQGLLGILKAVGRPGRLGPGRVAYARAKREGPQLRVFLADLPEQEQHW
jgi:hypothetical protein